MAVKAPTSSVVLGSNYETNQIYDTGMEFALAGRVDKKWKQATTFVFCKDFLHDAIWSMVNKRSIHVHDFHYNPTGDLVKVPKEPKYGTKAWWEWSNEYSHLEGDGPLQKSIPIHMGRVALLLRDTSMSKAKLAKRFHEHRRGALDFLHQIEKQMGFRKTEILQVAGAGAKEGPTWLILGDKKWMLAPTLISLYSMLIRIGYYLNPGGEFMRTLEMMRDGEIGGPAEEDDYYGYGESQAANDASYLKQAWKGIQVILKHGTKVFHPTMERNYPSDTKVYSFHDMYGIVAFASRKPAKRMPTWYRKSLWK